MRPLTPKHEQVLKDALFRHLNNLEPLGLRHSQAARGLLVRGLVEARDYIDAKRKKLLGFYLTNAGIEFLRHASNSSQLRTNEVGAQGA